mgnify:CR=1 FL=1
MKISLHSRAFGLVVAALALALVSVLSGVVGSPARADAPCDVGSWSSDGFLPCTPADIGYFVDSQGATVQLPCPDGTTTTTPGATSISECQAPVADVAAPLETAATTPAVQAVKCGFGVGARLGLPCILELSQLTSMKHSAVKVSVLKPSKSICFMKQGKLVAKAPGTCRILIKPEVVNWLGKKHKVSLTVA